LEQMTEREREEELFKRAERREELKKRYNPSFLKIFAPLRTYSVPVPSDGFLLLLTRYLILEMHRILNWPDIRLT
jgi:hypothetical protein